ncbi:MAG TPA: DUF488 domain-containing protein [Acidimicrobiales bacterium]|nr:DUF488 domain-containing protein [Acidimicrobiales bacterium]
MHEEKGWGAEPGPGGAAVAPGRLHAVALLTVGHGTLEAGPFAALLRGAEVVSLIDVRTAPGSRRNPAFGREGLQEWLPAAGVAYRWEPRLGGFRKGRADSPNTGLRHASFRAYADHMEGQEFSVALGEVLEEVRSRGTTGGHLAVMCAESLWWRCHRRLIADAAELGGGIAVDHLMHDGRLTAHRPTPGARLVGPGRLVYDVEPSDARR